VRRVLLDTECWLWWHFQPDRLNQKALEAFEDRRYPLLFSAASSWEIAIKSDLGRLKLPTSPERFVPARLAEDGIDPLPIQHAHALGVAGLPRHHADPFDRLLVAQARLERCTLMTADSQLAAYDVDTLWAGLGPQHHPGPRRRSARR
jgi:PIN domain nuclease of toxin-antitoxin system